MENNNSKLGIAAFLSIVANTTGVQGYTKYFILTVAVISLIIGIYQYQKAFKANQLSKDR
ncbi:hypothetical protein H9N25_14185 [Pedobacter riviphilus]|uniref:Uncharacterized protein n=1 Tax=Pedobacter riviphilus TaxID=2766984 RepID=A0ABX6TCA7_9SPHI|nr:hypothetical protein [Pedobacter riviphilus]QNR83119.1 hypothetical protein H9N25_14185 [Pedobacter riviphilus]